MAKPLSPVTSPANAKNGGSVARIRDIDYQGCKVIQDDARALPGEAEIRP